MHKDLGVSGNKDLSVIIKIVIMQKKVRKGRMRIRMEDEVRI